jgi:hypothetical protein
LPAAVVVAAGAVVVLAAVAVAVLVVAAARAANAAAEAAVRAIGDYGQRLEDRVAAQNEAEARSLRWQGAVAQVVELNGRIRMLTERASRTGVAVAVPEPLRLEGMTEPEVLTWLSRAAQLYAGAQATLHEAVAANESRQLAARLPQSVIARPNIAAALARHRATLLDRYAVRPTAMRSGAAEAEAIVGRLDVDANERERLDVLEAAAWVENEDPREADHYLSDLMDRVTATNAAVARRRLAAQWLSALEEPVVAAIEPPPPFVGTAAKLRAVVRGDEDMTADLRTEGAEAINWAQDVVRQRFVRDLVRDCLVEDGYTVDGEFDLLNSAELRLAHPDWNGEHSAEVWVDRDGTVHGQLVREDDIAGDEAAMRDRSRCDGFNADLVALGSRFDAAVVVDPDHVPQRRQQFTVDNSVAVRRPTERTAGS